MSICKFKKNDEIDVRVITAIDMIPNYKLPFFECLSVYSLSRLGSERAQLSGYQFKFEKLKPEFLTKMLALYHFDNFQQIYFTYFDKLSRREV